jgi:hypothetical protein
MYPGPSSPDRCSYEELSVAEVDAQIHKVLDLGVIPNPRVGLVPLWSGVASTRVRMLGLVFAAFAILSFHYAHDHALGLKGGRGKPCDAK